jgi:hypothetical protein
MSSAATESNVYFQGIIPNFCKAADLTWSNSLPVITLIVGQALIFAAKLIEPLWMRRLVKIDREREDLIKLQDAIERLGDKSLVMLTNSASSAEDYSQHFRVAEREVRLALTSLHILSSRIDDEDVQTITEKLYH